MDWQREIPVSTTVGEAYRLLRQIGQGLHGTVYEAQEQWLGRRCAIKVMNDAASSAEALARFHSQAEIASRLAHPHLVQVLDFGTAPAGEPFLVMEFLEGEDLARRQRRVGRFHPQVIGHIVKQLATGLAALHAEGLVHLALKPTNVFLTPAQDVDADFVKVLDFGTAQIENARTLDHPTVLVDTLPYVSPEQAGGSPEPLDARADQFSLACIAWEMLTGQAPFGGKDPTALLYQIVYEDPLPITDLTLQLPPGVMQVLGRALDKRREHRFDDIMTFALTLEQVVGPLPLVPRAPVARPAPLPVAQALVAPPQVSEPVFLPGLHHREPRRGGGPPPRAVRMHAPPPAPPPQQLPPEPMPAMNMVAAAAPEYAQAMPPPAQVTPRPSRRWLIVGALPVAASIALFANWTAARRRAQRQADEGTPVDVDRAAQTPNVAAAAAVPGPDIVPLKPPSPPEVKDPRLSRKARRAARRAALRSKAKARRVKAPR